MTNASEQEPGPVLTTTEARQGRRGTHVLWVLAASLVLVVLALFGTWLSRSGDLAGTNANNGPAADAAQAFNAPEPAPRALPASPPGTANGNPDPQTQP